MRTHSQDPFTAMKIIKHLCVIIIVSVGSLAAIPAEAGGCKFFGTTALSCEDGAGGYINTFFNGEKWTEPTSTRSASARDVPAGKVQIIRPIIIQQQLPQCRDLYCRTDYSDLNRRYYRWNSGWLSKLSNQGLQKQYRERGVTRFRILTQKVKKEYFLLTNIA